MADQNQIATQGLVLTEDEYAVVSNVLAASGKVAKSEHPRTYRTLQRVLGRLSQSMQQGKGLRESESVIHQKRIHEAFAAHDEKDLKTAVEDLIASTLRSDADPGLRVARYLMQFVTEVVAAQSRNGAATLTKLSELLEQAVTDWNAEGWPAAVDATKWIVDLVAAGRSDLELGQEAWAEEAEDEGDAREG